MCCFLAATFPRNLGFLCRNHQRFAEKLLFSASLQIKPSCKVLVCFHSVRKGRREASLLLGVTHRFSFLLHCSGRAAEKPLSWHHRELLLSSPRAEAIEMSQTKKQFVKVLCTESRSGIVYIFLEDEDNDRILAIVGRDLKPRQISYAVTEEFMEHVGLDKSQYMEKRWTSKPEVYDWLKNFVSNPPFDNRMRSGAETLLNAEMTRMGNVEGEGAKSTEDSLPTGDIEWYGSFTTDKGTRQYGAFRRNGVIISAQSFIYVFTTHHSHLIAYIESLYETRNSKKKMRVRWLHKKEEIDSENFSPKPHPKEVFMSENHQAIGLESFNGVAIVLSWDHFEWCTLLGQVAEAYVCRRLFHADGHVETFDIGTLQGYWDQHILSMAGIKQVNKKKKTGLRQPRRRTRSSSSPEGFSTEDKSHFKADAGRIKRHSMSQNDLGPNTEVEVLSEDSGLRGCWFRCHVLEKHSDKLKLKYQDVKLVDSVENLEEWHSLGTVAASDKLRTPGRWTIRPPPPKLDVSLVDEPGTLVDVQFESCWCEGVLICHLSKREAQVYLPDDWAENKKIKTFDTSRLRISRDWIGAEWIDLARANVSGKVSLMHCEGLFTGQVFNFSEGEPKPAFSDLESDISAAHQLSSDSDVPVTETDVTEVREEVLSDYSKGKVSDSGCISGADLHQSCVPVSSSRNFVGVNGSVEHDLELKQQDMDRFEKTFEPEIKSTGVMSKISRKRRHKFEVSTSAMSPKSVFFSLRGPMSSLVSNGLQGNENHSLECLTENDTSEVGVKRSRYGHEHVKPLNRSSAGSSLFNTVSTANLVMSR